MTVTVAVMPNAWWNRQKNVYTPGVVRVTSTSLAPLGMSTFTDDGQGPEPEVTLWSTPESLRHRTVTGPVTV